MKSEKVLNPLRSQELAKRHGAELLRDLVKLFKDYRPQIMALKSYIENEDYPQCRFIAHKVKGASANIGADRLYEDCEFFEELGLENVEPRDLLLKRYEVLKSDFDETVIELDRLITK